MSLYVLGLVLTAAFLHASWNLLSKKAQGKTPFIWLMYLVSSILYLPVLLFQKEYPPALWWFSLISAILHLGYYIVLQKGYRSADLSVVYPLARGSGPLFSSMVAILFLHEPLKLTITLGLLLMIAGVLLINGLNFKKGTDKNVMTGVFFGIFTGLFIALYTVNDTIAIKTYHLSPLTLTVLTNIIGTVLLAPFIIKQKAELKREIKQHKWIIIAIAVLSPAAYILVLEALKYAPLTVVAPARETSILLGVFMGSSVFKEKDGRRRLAASLLILIGIVLLGIS